MFFSYNHINYLFKNLFTSNFYDYIIYSYLGNFDVNMSCDPVWPRLITILTNPAPRFRAIPATTVQSPNNHLP